MAVGVELARVIVDEIAPRLDAAVEIGMAAVHAGIDHRDADALAARPALRIGGVDLSEAVLQAEVGIVVAGGQGAEGLQRLRQAHPRIIGQLLQQGLARHVVRNPQQHAMHP